MSLDVDEAEAFPELGIRDQSSWNALRSPRSGDDSVALLARARLEGKERAVLSSTEQIPVFNSSKERIEQAKEDWTQGRMKLRDADGKEFTPLPEDRDYA